MKRLLIAVAAFLGATIIVWGPEALDTVRLFKAKLRADAVTAGASVRIADALERAYPSSSTATATVVINGIQISTGTRWQTADELKDSVAEPRPKAKRHLNLPGYNHSEK